VISLLMRLIYLTNAETKQENFQRRVLLTKIGLWLALGRFVHQVMFHHKTVTRIDY